jgi:hypothetical protein
VRTVLGWPPARGVVQPWANANTRDADGRRLKPPVVSHSPVQVLPPCKFEDGPSRSRPHRPVISIQRDQARCVTKNGIDRVLSVMLEE